MTVSELISKLQTVLDEHGDIPFTCTILESTNDEDSTWSQDLVELKIDDCGDGPYCDLLMETNREYRELREARDKEAQQAASHNRA